ncbi:Phospholipid-transporting ATPase [Paragonimus heterotremus]|uniref:Phospholipid-transporting ATPase n=1 Tax=Paragonimus heterotremus TaxID=100268 RepID=A0A8J4X1P4_9TREM|nr:Phospholipid-transporting ATPase [Paragonimus heterotremus]
MRKPRWKFWKREPKPDSRTVYANQGPEFLLTGDETTTRFCSNAIISSRYTWINFVPKNLFEQFHNIANVFFAVITILYMFAEASTSIWANLGPLIAIIAITMIKDGVEDILRHRRDRTLNHMTYQVLQLDSINRTISWIPKKAMSIKVGDVVLCERDQAFPCDLVVLASSLESSELNVTTANLDGETNIKKYYAVTRTQTIYSNYTPERIVTGIHIDQFDKIAEQLYVRIDCQSPSADLGKFEGRLNTRMDTDHPLTFHNLVLRGAKLRNTDFMIGVTVYTGKETKLSLNGKQSKRKYSSREARSNIILLTFIVSMFVLAIIFASVFTFWTSLNQRNTWYIPTSKQTPWSFVQDVFRFIFILNYLIPISIIITLEFQQLLVAYLISSDLRMYSASEDLCAKANSAQLADELGQVEFLFSDKTGTLTQNVMRLCLCAIVNSNKVYAFHPSLVRPLSQNLEAMSAVSSSEGLQIGENNTFPMVFSTSESESESESGCYRAVVDKRTRKTCLNPDGDPEFQKFLIMAGLCHTVDVSKQTGSLAATMQNIVYEASSPDEKALVEGAANQGVAFIGKRPVEGEISCSCYTLESYNTCETAQGKEHEDYFVDAVLEFTSERKRMSVMVRHPDGTYHIHSKGAESAMLSPEICTSTAGEVRSQVIKHVTDFAVEGYRTLVFSSRQVNQTEYSTLLADLHKATGLVGQSREQAVKLAYAAIESQLQPMFVTAVEDQLQPGVKQCMCNLREAGIQIWILTGDKEETAITVSQAAGHFTQQMSLIRMTNCPDFQTAACWLFEQLEGLQSRTNQKYRNHQGTRTTRTSIMASAEEIDEAFLTALEQAQETKGGSIELSSGLKRLQQRMTTFIERHGDAESRVHRRRQRHRPGMGGEMVGLVIDGKTLVYLLDPTLREAFLDLCMNVTTVLCCRMTPLQKAGVVQLVQVGLSPSNGCQGGPVTAAVGDGGNDVAMLLQASVGIGIYGKEGLDAARAGDYSIPEFRHLTELFILHGHWAYHRLSFTMNLFYYKCTALVTTQILLAFYSGFSQMVSFGSLLFALYNLTMTSLGCLLYGMFERHLPDHVLLTRPYLYRLITRQANLTIWFVALWVLDGIWHGVVAFYATYFSVSGGLQWAAALFYDGNLNAQAAYDFEYAGTTMYIIVWISVNVRIAILTRDMNWIIFIGFCGTACNTVLYYANDSSIFVGLALSPAFWLTLLLAVFIANLPDLIWRVISDAWWSMQIFICDLRAENVPRKRRRELGAFWFQALVHGHREDGSYVDCTSRTVDALSSRKSW